MCVFIYMRRSLCLPDQFATGMICYNVILSRKTSLNLECHFLTAGLKKKRKQSALLVVGRTDSVYACVCAKRKREREKERDQVIYLH